MSWIDTIRAEMRKYSTWFYASLLAILPYADSIVAAIATNMPTLAEYLPANVYKALGVLIVVVNIVRSARTTHKKDPE